ncbi:hypothetical protein BDV19DRAFT_339052 [Aspergillus venezuelensis]
MPLYVGFSNQTPLTQYDYAIRAHPSSEMTSVTAPQRKAQRSPDSNVAAQNTLSLSSQFDPFLARPIQTSQVVNRVLSRPDNSSYPSADPTQIRLGLRGRVPQRQSPSFPFLVGRQHWCHCLSTIRSQDQHKRQRSIPAFPEVDNAIPNS